jgi:hypothetical protein
MAVKTSFFIFMSVTLARNTDHGHVTNAAYYADSIELDRDQRICRSAVFGLALDRVFEKNPGLKELGWNKRHANVIAFEFSENIIPPITETD